MQTKLVEARLAAQDAVPQEETPVSGWQMEEPAQQVKLL
jgi:hypothetical protein